LLQPVRTCPVFDGNIFVNAVEYNQAGEPIAIIYGYELRGDNPIKTPAGGPCNFLLPSNFRPGMISTFLPGLHERAFRIEVGTNETVLLWTMAGRIAQADLKAGRPSTTLNPLPSLPVAAVSQPYAQQLTAIGGKAALTWSEIAPLPEGITLSSDGKLSGTPTKAGQFIVRVRVSDGVTNFASAYSLTIGDGVVIDDAVSTRAAGFTPQFRLVSAAGNAINATAQCNANEFVIAGGGMCNVPNTNAVRGRLASSQPSADGWAVKCGFGAATAIAVCSSR
jgi:Putative Ig domain